MEFSIALGTMIRGTDDEKLALAFKILSPLRRARNAPGVSSLMAFQNGSNANAASYTTSSSSAGNQIVVDVTSSDIVKALLSTSALSRSTRTFRLSSSWLPSAVMAVDVSVVYIKQTRFL